MVQDVGRMSLPKQLYRIIDMGKQAGDINQLELVLEQSLFVYTVVPQILKAYCRCIEYVQKTLDPYQ